MIKMVMTCSAKCPICQRLIADKDAENLITRVKRHAQLRHNESISDVDIEDLSCVTRILGEKEQHDLYENMTNISQLIPQK
jgi:predicted small metal-binding protein